jgi:hypothetical protein
MQMTAIHKLDQCQSALTALNAGMHTAKVLEQIRDFGFELWETIDTLTETRYKCIMFLSLRDEFPEGGRFAYRAEPTRNELVNVLTKGFSISYSQRKI